MKFYMQFVGIIDRLLRTRLAVLRSRFWLVAVLPGICLPASHAQFYRPEYVTNSAFEAVSLPEGAYINYGATTQTINGWTYSGTAGLARDVAQDGTNAFPAPSHYTGGNYAFLANGPTPGTLRQTVNLPMRGAYQLHFYDVGAGAVFGTSGVPYTVSITDPQGQFVLSTQRLDGSYNFHYYVPFTVTTPGLHTIRCGDLGTFRSGFVNLDNISIQRIGFSALANGAFDAAALNEGQFQYHAAQFQPVNSWAFEGNSGVATDSANKSGFATGHPGRYSGTNYAFLQASGGAGGAMEQSVTVPVLGTWIMSFKSAGRTATGNAGGDARFRASILGPDGAVMATSQFTTSSGDLFTEHLMSFTAFNGGPFTLRFHDIESTSGTDNTAYIDDVQLIVPEQYGLVMVPNSSIDIINSTSSRWYIHSGPPAPAHMSKVSSSGISEIPWGSPGFTSDPVNFVQNRVVQREFLRVYAESVPTGTVLSVEASFTPLGERFRFNIRVTDSPFVRSINILDASPTALNTVRWQVTLSHEIVNVSEFNFALVGSGVTDAAITDVSGSGSNWVVTASTGTGYGLLGLNWVATAGERPNVPIKFTGQKYQFNEAPSFLDDPNSITALVGTPVTLEASAMLRSGAAPTYQWYEGHNFLPQHATPISGAVQPTLTLPATTNGYTRSFFLRAFGPPGYSADSATATVRIIEPPAITSEPADQIVDVGQTATLSVDVGGTAPFSYSWYRGPLGNTSNWVGNGSSFTTAALTNDAQFWVRVLNEAGPSYAVTSRLATVRVALTITRQPSGLTACTGNSATFTVAVSGGDGSTNLNWQRRVPGGSFQDIPGATNSAYTTPPVSAIDDGSVFRAIVNTFTGSLVSVEAPLSVITLSAPTVTYDFDRLPTNTAVYGNARSFGTLTLTGSGPGENGAWLTPDLAPGRLVSGFIAKFKVTMFGGVGSPFADGFSFNWSPDLPEGTYFMAEEGQGSGLSVCFDTFDNGGGEAPAIEVKWGGNLLARYRTNHAFLPGFLGNPGDVTIRLNTNGTLDLTYRCVSIFAGLPIPGYMPQFKSRFGLGARTGFYYETHVVDDLSLQLFLDPDDRFVSIPGLFNTGVDLNGLLLADNAVDPHYTIIANPDSASPDALTQNSQAFPIAVGLWVATNSISKWIGPRFDTSAASGGNYTYRTTFDLRGCDPATARIAGQWSSDDLGLDILFNGVPTGQNSGGYGGFTPFTITNGFVAGTNTLDFVLNNALVGYTGLRIQMAGLVRSLPPVLLSVQPQGAQVIVSWTPTAPNQQLQVSSSISGPWQTIVGATSPHTVNADQGMRFFRVLP